MNTTPPGAHALAYQPARDEALIRNRCTCGANPFMDHDALCQLLSNMASEVES